MPRLKFGKNTRIKWSFGDLNINIQGLDEAVVMLDRMIAKSSNLREPFQEFQSVWFASIDQNFADGGNPIPWPELSQAYADRAHGGDRTPTMRLSDTLYDSLTSQTGDTIWYAGPKSIQFGTRVPYFEFHQEGTSKMPARPVLTLSDDAIAKLIQLVEAHVMRGIPK